MPKITIDEEQWNAFEERAAEKGFDSTEDYVHHVLRQVYEKLQRTEDTYSEEDEEKVRDRLKNLGYLN